MSTESDHEQPIEDNPQILAFRQELEYRGKALEPFSHLRQTAAMNLGLRYWALSPDDLREIRNPSATPGTDEPDTVTVYDGLIHDTAIVLWLCNQPDSVCQRARRVPREFENKIDKWADENGITVGSDSLAEATSVFLQLVNSAAAAKGVPAEDKKNRAPAASGN